MSKIIKAPEPFIVDIAFCEREKIIFLAGSIDNGAVPNWQKEAESKLTKYNIIFNPRRDDWDSSWEQSIDNKKFVEQVIWEQDALGVSNKILIYFAPDSISAISLLEFGLYLPTNKLIVCCPDGFWKKGNIEVMCERFKIPCFNSLFYAISFANSIIK